MRLVCRVRDRTAGCTSVVAFAYAPGTGDNVSQQEAGRGRVQALTNLKNKIALILRPMDEALASFC